VTTATVFREEGETGFTLSRILLELTAVVPEITEQAFSELADEAKATCPISRALAGTRIEHMSRLPATKKMEPLQ
jgi:lipoyl-dependent peroxiredoxin